ncbi:MAG: hypothetical protein HZR80_01515 [Candidatus Heimdallarchaeota archaeon]
MDFTCAKCNTKQEKSPTLLSTGCPKCGSRVFKTTTLRTKAALDVLRTIPRVETENLDELMTTRYRVFPKVIEQKSDSERKRDLDEDSIPTIKLKEKGVYEVNIEGLFRDKKSDPIILSGKTGIYKVEMMLPEKKEQK